MSVCKAMGARRIIAIDISQGRLDFAKQYAATETHLATPMNEGEDRPAYSQRHVRPLYYTILMISGRSHIIEVWTERSRSHGH
jgi:threonine dehydrogenase-like Zn-dependent dehydrogenase